MSESPNIETLHDGLSSPFWAWFKSYVEAEWGAGAQTPEGEPVADTMAQGQGVM